MTHIPQQFSPISTRSAHRQNSSNKLERTVQQQVKRDEDTVIRLADSVSASSVNKDEQGKASCWGQHARTCEAKPDQNEDVSEVVVIAYQDLIYNGQVANFVSPSGDEAPASDEVPASAPSKTPSSVLELKDEVYSDEQRNPAKKGSFLHGLASWVGSSLSGLAKGINGLIHRLINLFAPVDNSYDAYKDYR